MNDQRFDRTLQLVGQVYVMPDYYEVGREKIRELSRALQNDHPAHHREDAAAELGYRGLVAPATFVSVVGSVALDYLFSFILVEYEITAVLQTEQKFVIHRPPVPGDRLVSSLTLQSIRQAAGADIMVVENHVTADGEDVVTSTTTFITKTDAEVDPAAVALVDAVLPAGVPRVGPTARPVPSRS
ncbi:FAS1-like dehydratase domain-containing protein [Rhodococcoides kroppenstedtii]|uniref:FAS1-like dehydratase domain-containing protein n=1 Tax=Rhodococcoides kroppenstedtii TaxID=293050 RepID=UPI001693DCBA|nr:hypothetical protein [Rhodococcus kroppenstedtii]